MFKRLFAPTVVLCACLTLGACSSISGAVADSWPTWAGGMPKDVPPRPGAPGYEEFIAHQQNSQAQAPAPDGSTAAASAPVAATAPVANNPAPQQQPLPPRAAPRPEDRSTVQGGLY